jgi:AcrR family transcriptional regulator
MSRHAVIRKERLVESARHVFLRHGYGASVKLIAAEAGVSEGSLFTHFKTKADLFKEAMEWDFGMESWDYGAHQNGPTCAQLNGAIG